jgi:thiol-disulfide isomerase/thioredoxin
LRNMLLFKINLQFQMKTAQLLSIALLTLLIQEATLGQNAFEIITSVKSSQAKLKNVSYSLFRTDTLVTGDIRCMSGRGVMEVSADDKLFGFMFWSQRNGFAQQTIYDGRLAYVADTTSKTYRMIVEPSDNLLYGTTGGQMIVKDLVTLDTTKAESFTASEDKDYYYLIMKYPDLTEHDVIKRYKSVTIDKKTTLPIAVRQHQETLGKVQDLNFQIANLKINEKQVYSFSDPSFLGSYKQEVAPLKADNPISQIKGTNAPRIELPSFQTGKSYPLVVQGKVTLLDFWEAWCGPCIASMPKIQELYEKYKNTGLEVYGIVHEHNQLEISKKRTEKAGTTFPMLIGNAESRHAYHIAAIPLYVLINREGKIIYLHEGLSDELEREIQKALIDKASKLEAN